MSTSSTRSDLLKEIEAFIAKHGMHPSYFGRDSVNDFSLLQRLRAGKDVRLETADKIRRFMERYKPGGDASKAKKAKGAKKRARAA